jgi:hypothetical protein
MPVKSHVILKSCHFISSNSKLYKKHQLVSGLYSAIQLISMSRSRKMSLAFTQIHMTDTSQAIKTL